MAKTALLKATLDVNAKKIEEKINEPDRKVALDDEADLISEIKKVLDDTNVIIDAHNKLIDKRDTEEVTLRYDIWATCLYHCDDFIKDYQRETSPISRKLLLD